MFHCIVHLDAIWDFEYPKNNQAQTTSNKNRYHIYREYLIGGNIISVINNLVS